MVQEGEIRRALQVVLVNAERIKRRILRRQDAGEEQRHADAEKRSDSHMNRGGRGSGHILLLWNATLTARHVHWFCGR